MSKKRTNYNSAFKAKLVLELLQDESILAEIVNKHDILSQNLVSWKKVFLVNAEIAMESSKVVKYERLNHQSFASHFEVVQNVGSYNYKKVYSAIDYMAPSQKMVELEIVA
jgi:transposase-like protein